MQMRGCLYGVLRDIEGNVIVSINIGKKLPELANIEGKDLDIKLTQHREKRGLTQNAYYWLLLSKLAAKLNISTARLHNLMLRDVAPPFIIDGRIAMQPIPDTDKAEEEILETETFHLKPTSGIIVGNDKNVYRWYIVLRGSSTFDTKEMTTLLDRLIEECKGNGIETATPQELEQMRKYSEELERRKS
jgi:hypothetical protein